MCLIWLIQQIRPMLGPSRVCPFLVGCTQYAIACLQEFNSIYAIFLIIKRLFMCNPIWLIYSAIKKTSKLSIIAMLLLQSPSAIICSITVSTQTTQKQRTPPIIRKPCINQWNKNISRA